MKEFVLEKFPLRTRIKICGIRTPDAARAAVDAGADAIGLVFVPGTPRAVTLEEAEAVLRVLGPYVEPIGLFVHAQTTEILDTCGHLGLRTVQLHGSESPAIAAALLPIRIVKAVALNDQAPAYFAAWTREPAPNLAAILWDAPPPTASPDPAQTGGHGKTIDWTKLASFLSGQTAMQKLPMVLAGGLTPDNVRQAISTVRPYAVDVSSGVESTRGVKDVKLIEIFCRAVRSADGGTA